MRIFVAFDLSIKTVERLVLLQEDLHQPLRDLGANPRWTHAANIHLTLKFIGEIERELVMNVRSRLRDVARRHPMFDVESAGSGCFPNLKTPRIVWAGVSMGADAVEKLAKDVEDSLAELGIPEESRPFKPHITIGRLRTKKQRVNVESVMMLFSEIVFGTTQVKDFALYESQLNPKGVIYRVLDRFPLPG